MRRVCLILCCLIMISCGGGPTSPSKTTTKIANYAGSWSGVYTITGCNQSGGVALVNICGSLGTTPSYSFNLSQSSRSVTGSFSLGTIQFANTGGTVGSDGSLGLNGTTISNGVTVIVTWALNMPATSITGTITQVWTSTTLSGQATVIGTISTANH